MADQEVKIVPEEEQELQRILSRYDSFPKLSKWITCFLDAGNKETWGNRTASALVAYDLDRTNPGQYNSARSIGYQNFTKLHNVAAEYIEQSGMTAGKQLELLTAKAVSSNNARYMQMLMEITELYTSKASVAINNNTQINTNVQISKDEENELNREFSDFIKHKARSVPAMNPDNPTGATG